jgi:hypothetical protein
MGTCFLALDAIRQLHLRPSIVFEFEFEFMSVVVVVVVVFVD